MADADPKKFAVRSQERRDSPGANNRQHEKNSGKKLKPPIQFHFGEKPFRQGNSQ